MRLRHLVIEAFGAVVEPVEFALDADVVVLLGLNGYGKTTFCDAIAWALTGEHPRGANPRNLYSPNRSVVVELRLAVDRSEWEIARTLSPGATSPELRVSVDGEFRPELSSDQALRRALVWIDPGTSGDVGSEGITSFYLKQETLRDFLHARSDRERFSALASFVGSQSLAELVGRFETEKNSYTRELNATKRTLEEAEAELSSLRLAEATSQQECEALVTRGLTTQATWLGQARALLPRIQFPDEEPQLETARRLLLDERSALTARIDELSLALEDLRSPDRAAWAQERLADARVGLAEATQRATEVQAALDAVRAERRRLEADRMAQQTLQNEFAALAELALRHVGRECPTCGQDVDPIALERRLRRMANPEYLSISLEDPMSELQQRTSLLEAAREDLLARERDASVTVQDLEAQVREANELRVRREERAASLQAALADQAGRELATSIDELMAETIVRRRTIESLLAVAPRSDADDEIRQVTAVLARWQRRLETAGVRIAELRTSVERMSAAHSRGDRLLRALRSDSEEFVAMRLASIQPLIRHMYAAVEPHPTFSELRLVTRTSHGKQRLDAVLRDPSVGVEVPDPATTLSTSQANAVAVVLHLAFNLGLRPSRLDCLLLDDPLQNLDDVHLLGLVDTLRKVTGSRQLLLTTHDRDFANLLVRKLRPSEGRRLTRIEIESWSRGGPTVHMESIEVDSGFSLAAAPTA